MLILNCPYCGVDAEETELAAGGEAHLKRFGPGSSDDDFHDYLFMKPQRRSFRTLAPCQRLRQVVPRGPLHANTRSLWHLLCAGI